MITLDTFRALHEHDHKLAAYCTTCDRWAVLDLERLIAEDSASYCRGMGAWQLRPPAHGAGNGRPRLHLSTRQCTTSPAPTAPGGRRQCWGRWALPANLESAKVRPQLCKLGRHLVFRVQPGFV